MVSDYGPGIDAETWFTKGFKDAGGEIVGSVRMPIASADFSAFVQRAKDVRPRGDLHFHPGRSAAGGHDQGDAGARHPGEQDPRPG